ncbi:MAG: energy-coupling factor ABC transporter permease [Candidatus Eisenbacteria bacterium]
MSHLHIPDGVLPPIVWIAGLVLALFGVLVSAAATRDAGPLRIAFQSALGGLMLAVMAIPVPITAFDYCMTLAGPVGVLLGAASTFQVCFVVTVILALMGQGGFTVIGLNALVLGLGAMTARPVARLFATRMPRPHAVAAATAVSQLFSSALWIGVLVLSVKLSPVVARDEEVHHTLRWLQGGTLVALLTPLLLVAVTVESLLAFGLARFLDKVRPDLLAFTGGTAHSEAPEAPDAPTASRAGR